MMNIKELNALNLLALQRYALTTNVTRTCTMFACDPTVVETIKGMSETRIRKLAEDIDVPLFGLRLGESHPFWRDAAVETNNMDWELITRMRSLLISSSQPQPISE